jgi:hypothetical protein
MTLSMTRALQKQAQRPRCVSRPSAYTSIAGVVLHATNWRFGLIADPCSAANAPRLFDDIAENGEQSRRHGEAERLRGFEVDHELEFGRLLDR